MQCARILLDREVDTFLKSLSVVQLQIYLVFVNLYIDADPWKALRELSILQLQMAQVYPEVARPCHANALRGSDSASRWVVSKVPLALGA